MQRQHAQALEIARKDNFPPSNKDFETEDSEDTVVLHPRNDREKLQSVDGVQYVVRVDNDGNFESAKLTDAIPAKFRLHFQTSGRYSGYFRPIPQWQPGTGGL